MAENKMNEVAELLGVEIGVPFNIKGYPFNPCKLTHDRIENKSGNMKQGSLFQLLTGELEIEQPILNDEEKRYLEDVFRPFKDRVMYIEKVVEFGYENIRYRVSSPTIELFELPYFDKGTMYKGMELGKQYSVKELWLFESE